MKNEIEALQRELDEGSYSGLNALFNEYRDKSFDSPPRMLNHFFFSQNPEAMKQHLKRVYY